MKSQRIGTKGSMNYTIDVNIEYSLVQRIFFWSQDEYYFTKEYSLEFLKFSSIQLIGILGDINSLLESFSFSPLGRSESGTVPPCIRPVLEKWRERFLGTGIFPSPYPLTLNVQS